MDSVLIGNTANMNIQKEFGSSLSQLFNDYQNTSYILRRGFASAQEILSGTILFIGLNPSYTEDVEPNEQGELFYPTNQNGNQMSYFKKFEDISNYTNESWSHLDLLTLRETNQKNVMRLLKSSEGLEFIWKHLRISKLILEKSRPKLIVVSNTGARLFLGKDKTADGKKEWMNYQFKFDPSLGTYCIQNDDSNLKGLPVFFTSMLSGQRALDNGSYERLKWQICFVLNRMKDRIGCDKDPTLPI